MASILPDCVLNELLCSICKKYLSYSPTKVHRNGGMSCGRCNTNETTTTSSIYEKVAKFSLFPCVNRYEGCNILLQYKDVSQHEKTCRGIQYSCPLCAIDHQFSLLNLIDHYKAKHKELVLTEPKFLIDTKTMSENIYLYCDNLNNCLFFIEISCTEDRLLLSAFISRSCEVLYKFRLNNIFHGPDNGTLCSTLGGSKLQHIEVNITDEWKGILACEFLYNVTEKTVSCVALELNSGEENPKEIRRTKRMLPKIYLDNKIFPEKKKYKLSLCKSKVINDFDNVEIKLKCDICDMYLWNVSQWNTCDVVIDDTTTWHHGIYCCKYKDSDELICTKCYSNHRDNASLLFETILTEPILNLLFYCRYNCGMVCSVWQLYAHESSCEFNLEKNTDEFVKKCFGGNSFNADDRFVIGNVVARCEFDVAFYSLAIYGPDPKIQNSKDVVSPEKVIYLITDDGLKCKVNCKYDKGNFCVHVEHDYDRSRYLVNLCVFTEKNNYTKKVMYVEKSEYLTLSKIDYVHCRAGLDGTVQYIDAPCFVVSMKKISPSCNLIL